jgi:hypothetical protein
MDDLLINKIAPLCPFLYLTLRLVCKKYWKALGRKNIENFGRIFSFYLQKDNLYFEFSLLKPKEQVFFIKAIEPEFRDYSFDWLSKPRGYPRGIVFYVPEAGNLHYNMIYNEMIGQKNHQDFAEYVCQNMCQLKCCGNTWHNYLTSLRKEWTLAYDAVNKVFILECFFLLLSSFFF